MSEKKYFDVDAAYDSKTLTDWYISSVDDNPPVWTDEHIYELLNDFYVIPKDTKPADAAPVDHAHWIWVTVDDAACVFCSQCRTKAHPVTETSHPDKFKFCPHCGAKMDESEESGNE